MKFTDGQWLLRKGVTMYNPMEAKDYKIGKDGITIFAPVKHINQRGDTIDSGILTIKYSSPLPDIICVQIYHYKGQKDRKPNFLLNKSDANEIKINDSNDALSLKSGDLSIIINKEKYSIEFLNNDISLTKSNYKNTAYLIYDNIAYMREQLELKTGECVYGLGERFTSFVKNGQVVDIWNEDGGTSSWQSYKNIPFYLTNKGYGVFVNHSEKVSYEIASESVSKVQFSVEGEYLEYYIINGPTPKKVIENYTLLTGRPALLPPWSFGLWLSTSFTTQYDEETATSFINGMKERDLPLSVFHFDCFWMKEYHLSDLQWNAEIFPDPKGMIKRLKEKGLKISVWINPYIAQRSRLFEDGKEKEFLLKKTNGDVWQWNRWQAGMAIVDFTNPAACEWYVGYLEELLDMGVDCFKTDFGERIPVDVVYHDGSDPLKMHNYYSYLYNKIVFDVLEKKYGKGNSVLFSRSATVGSQKYPLHWGGDSWGNYESMAESLRGGLSLCLSGFGYWSHDIGGFESKSPSDVYKRWIAFGLLSSHSRLHGSSSYKVPWSFDEESVDVLRFFTKLKYSLMPYIFSKSVESVQKGLPILRAMILEFPDDPGCDYLDRQYMLGDSLLASPVFSNDGTAIFYLPEGNWTNFFTGEIVKGGTWKKGKYDFLSLPLFVRENSIIAVGKHNDKPDYEFADDVTLHLYGLTESCRTTCIIYDEKADEKLRVDVIKKGNTIEIDPLKVYKPWNIVLHGIDRIKKCNATYAGFEEKTVGIMIKPEVRQEKIFIEL